MYRWVLLQQARPSPATSNPLPPAGAASQAAARGVEAGGVEGRGGGGSDAEASKEAARKEAKRLAFMEDRARIQVFAGEPSFATCVVGAELLFG